MARRPLWWSFATLATTRSLVRGRRRRLLVGTLAAVYLLVAMYLGEMLVFAETGDTYQTLVVPSAFSPANWAYPAAYLIAPGVVIVLPILSVLTMGLVALGVGLGMGAALVLLGAWGRERRRPLLRPSGVASSMAGITPFMLGLLTLGACCSTALASAAGVGLLTQGGGAGASALFADVWYLALLQVTVIWIALVAQEALLRTYLAVVRAATPAPNLTGPAGNASPAGGTSGP